MKPGYQPWTWPVVCITIITLVALWTSTEWEEIACKHWWTVNVTVIALRISWKTTLVVWSAVCGFTIGLCMFRITAVNVPQCWLYVAFSCRNIVALSSTLMSCCYFSLQMEVGWWTLASDLMFMSLLLSSVTNIRGVVVKSESSDAWTIHLTRLLIDSENSLKNGSRIEKKMSNTVVSSSGVNPKFNTNQLSC